MKIMDRVPECTSGTLVVARLSIEEARQKAAREDLQAFIIDPLRVQALAELLGQPIVPCDGVPTITEGENFLLVDFLGNHKVAAIYEARLFHGW